MKQKAKIVKFVALLGSEVEAEALAALRALKAELSRQQMNMSDVANLLVEGKRLGGEPEPRFHSDMSEADLETFRKKMDILKQRFKFEDHYNEKGLSYPRRHSEAVYIMIGEPALSDREIGRRVDLSPTVIGRLRRIVGCDGPDRVVRRSRGDAVQEYRLRTRAKPPA